MTHEQFRGMTPRRYTLALGDHAQMQQGSTRSAYEAARIVAISVWNAAGKTLKRPIKDPTDFMPLPWDKRKEQTPQDMKTMLMAIAKAHNRKVHNESR